VHTEQNKSSVTNHVRHHSQPCHRLGSGEGDHYRESNKMDRWIKEAIYIRKEQDKAMTSGPINSLMSVTSCSPQRHLAANGS